MQIFWYPPGLLIFIVAGWIFSNWFILTVFALFFTLLILDTLNKGLPLWDVLKCLFCFFVSWAYNFCHRYIKSVYGEYKVLSRCYVFFCIQTKPEHIRQDKNSLLFFGNANTPPEICEKAKRQQSARPQKAGKTHDKKPERIRLIVIINVNWWIKSARLNLYPGIVPWHVPPDFCQCCELFRRWCLSLVWRWYLQRFATSEKFNFFRIVTRFL